MGVAMNTDSQCSEILAWLQSGGTITNLAASMMYGCERLGARIHELRSRGHNIRTRTLRLRNGKRVGLYYMEKS
jgi:hypothetical protein